jgi:glyoxylase-like metal-dependent hydrolase (beta-lactamase superfamily II)
MSIERRSNPDSRCGEAGGDRLTRRKTFALGATLSLLPVLGSTIRAEAKSNVAKGNTCQQVPGLMLRTIGTVEVTAVSDGVSTLPLDVVPNADPFVANELAEAAYLPPNAPIPIAINTYLIRSGGKLALVDTGGGRFFGPSAGVLQQNLKAAGVHPNEIDILILTHLHPDHVAGMTTDDGRAVFPNAMLFVHEAELTYWNDDGNLSRAPNVQKPWFLMARRALKPYLKKIEPLTVNGQTVLPGVNAEELPGHTPGHTGLRIASGSDQMLIWGDIIHFPHLQLPEPDWGLSFDVDTTQFIATRRRTFAMAAADRMLVTGMHLGFPGFGHVTTNGPTGYAFIPESWRYAP